MRPSFRWTLVVSALLLIVAVGSVRLLHFGSGTTHASGSTPTWHIVASPNVGTGSALNAIKAISATNVWAVGYSSSSALVEHWNGKQWSVVSSPNVGAGSSLSSLAALSATNIWAVGDSNGSALIEHYNGTQWGVVNSPTPPTYTNYYLSGIAFVSATNIWAVGNFSTGGGTQTLIEHWDGSQWSVVPSPNGDNFSVLSAVKAVSATNVWAVGYSWTSQDSQDSPSTLIEHWNGSQWSVVNSPTPGSGDTLNALAIVSANDIRAVGSASSSSYTLSEQWNGKQWSVVSTPNAGFYLNVLRGVVALSTSNVWAVGEYTSQGSVSQTLTEHWNGSQWSVVASPNVGSAANELSGITYVPSTTILWAVGYIYSSNGYQPLIESYS